jgi:predicted TPR repeat methyltransferase
MANRIKLGRTSGRDKKMKRVAGQAGASSSQSTLQQAVNLHSAGHLVQAEALYKQILSVEPDHPEALQFLGLLAHQVGKSEIAVELIKKALACRPNYVEAHYHLGIILHAQGKPGEAATSFRRALALKADFAEAHNNLGNVLQLQDRPEEAAASFRRALALKPDFAEAYNNLGNALQAQGKTGEAVALYRQALTLKPDYAEAHNNLGIALKGQGKLEEAVGSFTRALTLKPDYVDADHNLGASFQIQGKLAEAISCFRRVLSRKPDATETLFCLANALYAAGDLIEAVSCYRLTLDADSTNATARHMLAAATGTLTDKAPIKYVADTFDSYADQFDRHLTGLGYQVPAVLREVVARVAGETPFCHGLDLGCGTGLVGTAFRDLTERLTGIDLSAGMLEKAEAKGVYDNLHKEEIVSFLQGAGEQRFDLFLAADVFVYLGDLAPIFAAIRERAATPAWLAFSIERAGEEWDYELLASGRYAQSVEYILRLASEHGFVVTVNEEQTIRMESGRRIDGNIFVLRIP